MESYAYQRYVESFKEWLRVLNYSGSTAESSARQLEEFFNWLQDENITGITEITRKHVLQWYDHLKYTRKSQRTDTFLKAGTLNSYISTLKLFAFYLQETEQASLTIDLVCEKLTPSIRHILTTQEVQELYQSTTDDAYGMRDRTMLSLYYGCGIRSREGIALNLDDVMLNKKMLYVREGKGYKERYVPFVEQQQKDFEHYLKYARPELLKTSLSSGESLSRQSGSQGEVAFLIGHQSKRISYGMLLRSLKQLQQRTGNETLKEKVFGLHALRHSIATHLMQRGMKFDYISQFLGHSSLNSTQIYTHLAHEYEDTSTDRT